MALNLRAVEVFKPYANELPEALLEGEGLTEQVVERWLSSETLRVAKIGAEVLGAYAMDRIDEINFELHGVIIERRVRKQGLGRWLVGHAIGVAESKGGRHLHTGSTSGTRMYKALGFVPSGERHTFDMIQE